MTVVTEVLGNTFRETGDMLSLLRTDEGKIEIHFETEFDYPVSASLLFPCPEREYPLKPLQWVEGLEKRKGLGNPTATTAEKYTRLYSLKGFGRGGLTKHVLTVYFPDVGAGILRLFVATEDFRGRTCFSTKASLAFRVENTRPAYQLEPMHEPPTVYSNPEEIAVIEPWRRCLRVGETVQIVATKGITSAAVYFGHVDELAVSSVGGGFSGAFMSAFGGESRFSGKVFLKPDPNSLGLITATVKIHRSGNWYLAVDETTSRYSYIAEFSAEP
ncbi:hypothetical protein HDU96_003274 [Phlyctochytrium bullatum]|nr:hypothetical protein HDU96_003274 [Phlyctochytrium bullatum]